jgi:hypothetical protein
MPKAGADMREEHSVLGYNALQFVEIKRIRRLRFDHVGTLLGLLFDHEMEVMCSSEMFVEFHQTTHRHIPEDGIIKILNIFVINGI